MNHSSSGKDPGVLLEEADGHPIWLKEALEKIWLRLPPAPPVKLAPPTWDPQYLAKLQLDPVAVLGMSANDRWLLSTWLKRLAKDVAEGHLPEGDSKDGFRTIFVLGKGEKG